MDESEQKPMRGVRKNVATVGQGSQKSKGWLFVVVLAVFLFGIPISALFAQDPPTTKKFSPQVVAKAEKILEEIGLRQSGKTISSSKSGEISRAITGLIREKRQLKLINKEWTASSEAVSLLQAKIKQMDITEGELSLKLAAISADDISARNGIVALINAGRIQVKLLRDQLTQAREAVAKKRQAVGTAESEYAETVLAIRKDFDALHSQLAKDLASEKVKISLNVMTTNNKTPADLTAKKILGSLEKRITRLEQEVFRASIPLEAESSGALFVNVVVGTKNVRMVLDSGASLICLPADTAKALGVTVPKDATELRLALADGREIPAHAVILPRVRVGEFEAKNVRTAVLHPQANNAEPLLGMSFLGNFKFEINANEKSLTMLRVSAE